MHELIALIHPFAVTGTDLAGGLRTDAWDLILHAGPVVKAVIALLIMLSAGCWGIMLFKHFTMRAAVRESERFLHIFWEHNSLATIFASAEKMLQSPLAEMFRSAYLELQRLRKPDAPGPHPAGATARIKRALTQAATAEQTRLEKYLGFLATTGSTAPFIGLFGTVWGIMDAFRQIGLRGSANLATVAPGISEALIATAFGLIAAIPAVIAYNYYLGRVNLIATEMDNFSSEFLNIVETHFDGDGADGDTDA